MSNKLYDKPIQHGELVLKPVKKLPKGDTRIQDSLIGAASTSGHNHVLQSLGMKVVTADELTFVEVTQEGQIVQTKVGEHHADLRLPIGIYQINIKTEYDLFEDRIRDVQD